MTDKADVIAALQAAVEELATHALTPSGADGAASTPAWLAGVLEPVCQRLRQAEAWPAANAACSAVATVVPCASTSLALGRAR